MFTQTLICNDKVNDGAYLAVETNFPEGTIANLGDAEGSTGIAWAFLQPAFTGYPRTLSRALQARGFIEEVIGAYSVSGNVIQGGGIDQYGNSSAIMNFEIAAQGMGAKYVLDGTDTCAAMFNPEGDAGDVEMWELICPMVYLSRRIKPNTGGPGRHRGGSSFESLQLIHNTPFWELQNLGTTRLFTSQGIFGGYPGSVAYVHNIRANDLRELAEAGEAYPVADGPFDDPALMAIEGEREYKQDNFTLLEPFAEGDLYHSVMKGAAGLGDPLQRPAEAVAARRRRGAHRSPSYAERGLRASPTARAPGAGASSARGRRAEWWEAERERVLAGDLIEPIKVGYAESMKLSPRWAAEFRGFWDLPEDFAFDVATPTVPAGAHARCPARSPRRSRRPSSWPRSQVARVEPPALAGKPLEPETLEALLDEKLSRREVKDIQSGYKDPDRFEKWVALLQARVECDDPIVLPLGEGLNVVRRRDDGELVIRSDAGHDFCRADRNWKMHAPVFVRDTDELLREIYPRMAHCDPEWMELREFYCPRSGRLLEVEAVTARLPGRPRLPPRHRGLLPRLARARGPLSSAEARRHGRLAGGVQAPADGVRVRLHGAAVVAPDAQGAEGTRGGRGLAGAVVAPAGERRVRLHPAGEDAARAHGPEVADRRARLAEAVEAPAGQRRVDHHAAGVALAAGHRAEGPGRR